MGADARARGDPVFEGDFVNVKGWVEEHTIYRVCAGSRLYGTARPDSDYDWRGVCAMPPRTLLGMTGFEQYQGSADEDLVIYGLTKFFKLALGCNPNILEILFAPPSHWDLWTPPWRDVYNARHSFLSQRVRYTFSGYARSQLKRLQGHYQWLKNPPKERPEPSDFGGWLEQDEKGGQTLTFPHIDAERRYKASAKTWKQYQTWLRERNPARARLEARYGYDTKHAMNLVRMMIKGAALLTTGDYNPVLDDDEKEFVMEVYRGEWSYERLVDWADTMDNRLQTMETCLPKVADHDSVEKRLMRLNMESLKGA